MAIHDNHVMEEPSIRLWQLAYYFLLLLQQISLPLYHRHVRRNVEPKVRQDTVSLCTKTLPSSQLDYKSIGLDITRTLETPNITKGNEKKKNINHRVVVIHSLKTQNSEWLNPLRNLAHIT